MAASLDFISINTCSGGNHHSVGVRFTLDGVNRDFTIRTETEFLAHPIDEEEMETMVKLLLRAIRAQNPANLRQAILNKVINLDVT